jgi:hypothetical protein
MITESIINRGGNPCNGDRRNWAVRRKQYADKEARLPTMPTFLALGWHRARAGRGHMGNYQQEPAIVASTSVIFSSASIHCRRAEELFWNRDLINQIGSLDPKSWLNLVSYGVLVQIGLCLGDLLTYICVVFLYVWGSDVGRATDEIAIDY